MTVAVDCAVHVTESETYLREQGLDVCLAAPGKGVLPPDPDDLTRLHRFVRRRRAFTVLEFGVGYSTLVIADALAKNAEDFAAAAARFPAPSDAFRLFSVDTGTEWIETTSRRLPARLRAHVVFSCSAATVGTFKGQLCHFYDRLPDAVPDFVYLDGPDPRAVTGTVNGVGFQSAGRTPLAADLLLLEPSFVPGLMILIDGRVNNARFLQRNFRRDYMVHEDPSGRFSTIELTEPPLGRRNRQCLEYCLEKN